MIFDLGDVILVPFPFTNQSAVKKRPALVISARRYNEVKPDVILMAVTSQFRPSAGLGETWLEDWQAANLLKPSVVKPVFATLEQSMVIRRMGTLSARDVVAVRAAIRSVIG